MKRIWFALIILLALCSSSYAQFFSALNQELPCTSVASCRTWEATDTGAWFSYSDSQTIGDSSHYWTTPFVLLNYWEQATSGNRPTLHKTGGPNSHPYLSFDETDSLVHGNSASNFLSGSGWTMFFVVRPQRNGTTHGTENGPNLYQNGYTGITLFDASGSNKFRVWRDAGGSSYVGANSTTTYATNTWYVVEAWYDNSSLHIRVNGDADSTVSATPPGSLFGSNAIMSGGNASGYSGAAFDLTCFMTFSTDIGSTQRDNFRCSLGHKYGVSVSGC